jgi:hypothetical protein
MEWCSECGYEVQDGARFCITCGAAVAVTGATVKFPGAGATGRVMHLGAGSTVVSDVPRADAVPERPIPLVDTYAWVAARREQMFGVYNAPSELHPMWRGANQVQGQVHTVQHPMVAVQPKVMHGARSSQQKVIDWLLWDNPVDRMRARVQNSWLVQTEAGTIAVGLFLLVLFLVFIPMLLV